MMRVVHDLDHKSPYAYLAQEETFRLASEIGVVVDRQPYTLDVPRGGHPGAGECLRAVGDEHDRKFDQRRR